RAAYAIRNLYVYENENAWWSSANNDRMDLVSERTSFEPGETMTFQARAPFKKSTALVTVEREGVIDAFTVELNASNQMVSVPIKKEFAPNAYVSVLAIRGRSAEFQPTALVDLGKPSFRIGMKGFKVGWAEHEIKVKSSTTKKIYQAREKVVAEFKLEPPKNRKLAVSEIAVAVVDEALLELLPNDSWQLLPMMMKTRNLNVRTATNQMHVVGKRHFGKKALAQGGGGGRDLTRELFDTLVYWNPRVAVAADGTAKVEFPLGDSISKFRVVAIANSGEDMFGMGESDFVSKKDLEIISGLPPVIREGDELQAHVTLRNTTLKPMTVDLKIDSAAVPEDRRPHLVQVPAEGSHEVTVPFVVPPSLSVLPFQVTAVSKDGHRDSIKLIQKVVPLVPVQTYQATLVQLTPKFSIPIEKPGGALPRRGGVEILYRAKISEGLKAVEDYFRIYPYNCLEQQISKSIVLNDRIAWKKLAGEMSGYLDDDGLFAYFPGTVGSDILSSYALLISSESRFEMPVPVRDKLISGLQKIVRGEIEREMSWRSSNENRQSRKLVALDALARFGKADASLIQHIQIRPQSWTTESLLHWMNALDRIQNYPAKDVKLAEADRILRARVEYRGTRIGFTNERTEFDSWLMTNPDRTAASLILRSIGNTSWGADVPKMVQGMLVRQVDGIWYNTTANAWAVLALRKFSEAFEKQPVTGVTTAELSGVKSTINWKAPAKQETLPFPEKSGSLALQHSGTGRPWAVVQIKAA
ncbi:MAG: alpha-2-macroglobulin family protein, partial [Bdellovibrionota bacterium]